MFNLLSLSTYLLFIFSMAFPQKKEVNDRMITNGRMPGITVDKNNSIHIVFGRGDSIMCISSRDGKTFSSPSLVTVLPNLMAYAMRGPQIATTENGLVITACTKQGNINCYIEQVPGKWINTKRINETNESAREALMALSADGLHVYAVWLGVKSPKGQNIYGSASVDGGKTWSKNILVYTSPDGTVCECCKPSVAVHGNNVFVMFRNFINGNRDLYLIKSTDGGRTYGSATKLGNKSWKLNGCPMDGGGLVISNKGTPETVWQRNGKIYAASLGTEEKEIGKGRGCSIETINGKNIYCWSDNDTVTVLKPDGVKINLGNGSLPLLKVLNPDHLICVWENEKEIHSAVIDL